VSYCMWRHLWMLPRRIFLLLFFSCNLVFNLVRWHFFPRKKFYSNFFVTSKIFDVLRCNQRTWFTSSLSLSHTNFPHDWHIQLKTLGQVKFMFQVLWRRGEGTQTIFWLERKLRKGPIWRKCQTCSWCESIGKAFVIVAIQILRDTCPFLYRFFWKILITFFYPKRHYTKACFLKIKMSRFIGGRGALPSFFRSTQLQNDSSEINALKVFGYRSQNNIVLPILTLK